MSCNIYLCTVQKLGPFITSNTLVNCKCKFKKNALLAAVTAISCTGRVSVQGVTADRDLHSLTPNTHPLWTEWQTRVQILPYPKLSLRPVIKKQNILTWSTISSGKCVGTWAEGSVEICPERILSTLIGVPIFSGSYRCDQLIHVVVFCLKFNCHRRRGPLAGTIFLKTIKKVKNKNFSFAFDLV